MPPDFRFKIGTQYIKRSQVYTVTDQLTTMNSKGEIVKKAYVVTHEFLGQTVSSYDVCETTIARALMA